MLSLGQLFDDGCHVIFKKQKMYTIKNKEVVIEGEHNHQYNLWGIIIPSHPNDKMSTSDGEWGN